MEGWGQLPAVVLFETYSYLSHEDRLKASLVCKSWRSALFYPRFWRNVCFNFIGERRNRARFLSEKVGPFVSVCVIVYDSSSSTCERDVEYLLQQLSKNHLLSRLIFQPMMGCATDEPRLRKKRKIEASGESQLGTDFRLTADHEAPSSSRSSCYSRHGDHGLQSFQEDGSSRLFELVLKLCGNSTNQISHVSLGCVTVLTNCNAKLVKLLSQTQAASMQALHINRANATPVTSFRVHASDMMSFRQLHCLSIDLCDLSETMLIGLTENGRPALQQLVINVHNHTVGTKPIKQRTWALVRRNCPSLSVTLNLIHCMEAMTDLLNLIPSSIPLTHFRAFFCNELNVPGLHFMARNHQHTLQSFHIIDKCDAAEGPLFYDIDPDEQDPFVMMAWKCARLTALCIIGICLWEHDVLAIARLRGKQLARFDLVDDCVMPFNDSGEFEEDYNMSHQQFCDEISSCVGRKWAPLRYCDLHPAINSGGDDVCAAFLPTLLSDHLPHDYQVCCARQ